MKLKVELDEQLLAILFEGARRLPAEYFIGKQLEDLAKQIKAQLTEKPKEEPK